MEMLYFFILKAVGAGVHLIDEYFNISFKLELSRQIVFLRPKDTLPEVAILMLPRLVASRKHLSGLVVKKLIENIPCNELASAMSAMS